jgi:hypothetical protein
MSNDPLLDDALLRERVRERAEQGRVPCRVPRAILPTRVGGATCAICDVVLTYADAAYELAFGSQEALQTVYLHRRCYMAWEAQCLRGNSPHEGPGA